jgi:hypothetical protein
MRYLLLIPALMLGTCTMAGEKRGEKRMERAMGGGPIEFILEHEKELNLTDAQKKQLKEQEGKNKEKMEKMMKSPEMRAQMEEMREARKSGDEEKMQEFRRKMMEKMAGGEGQRPGAMLGELASILKPDQLAKLRELREKEGKPTMTAMAEKRRDRKESDSAPSADNRPKRENGVPTLYDKE